MQRYRGFTLIELLMVVVIIGLLAAVLIPKFANSREKAFMATMKSDLRNLATAQESYFYDNQEQQPFAGVLSLRRERGCGGRRDTGRPGRLFLA